MLFFFGLHRLARCHLRMLGEGSFLGPCPFLPENFLDALSFILFFGEVDSLRPYKKKSEVS